LPREIFCHLNGLLQIRKISRASPGFPHNCKVRTVYRRPGGVDQCEGAYSGEGDLRQCPICKNLAKCREDLRGSLASGRWYRPVVSKPQQQAHWKPGV